MKSAKLSRLLLLFALVLGTAALVRGAAVPSEDDAELIEPDPFDESGFDEDTEFADHVTLDKRQTNLLNADQKNDLKYWVEEEKLALDVYNVFKAKWGKYTQVFGNIAKSESTHLTSVRKLLKTYGIPDPSARKAAGVFADPTLQSLYTQFVNKGSATIRAALEVGKEIEEMDLKDLARSKVLFANIPSVLVVLKNQIKSSENHKRAFERVLRVWG